MEKKFNSNFTLSGLRVKDTRLLKNFEESELGNQFFSESG